MTRINTKQIMLLAIFLSIAGFLWAQYPIPGPTNHTQEYGINSISIRPSLINGAVEPSEESIRGIKMDALNQLPGNSGNRREE